MSEPKPDYYTLTPVFQTQGMLVNASIGICCTCGGVATGMGGSNGDVCLRCAEVLMSGQARHTIVWNEKD
jgi:hypothetical protein